MKVIKTIAEYRKIRCSLDCPIGFVPTMGYLHEGHISLVREARKKNLSLVVSIFVNPTQFGPKEDFNTYPRDLERDLTLLDDEGVNIIFCPSIVEMYPPGFDCWIEVTQLSNRLEGIARPGHFRGVTTIVAKLLNIINPDRAYFGQKDAQQASIIKKMVSDLNLDLKIVVLPTVRGNDGLAISSRNVYLNKEERKAAKILFKALNIAERLHLNGENDARLICNEMTKIIESEPLASIDYISIADSNTLNELDKIIKPALVSLAVFIGKTRLIDNIILN
jgi:pantoate--beta-alanine ligase